MLPDGARDLTRAPSERYSDAPTLTAHCWECCSGMNSSRVAVLLLYAVFVLATNWPILLLVNRIEPRVGPFPLLAFWMALWSIGIGVVHLVYGLYRVRDPKIPVREPLADEGEDQ
jgi:hypothetical protein